MFDGRCTVNNFRNYYAYVFEASYSDHSSVKFRCNPEFGRSEASRVATHYATALGRIPEVFRSRVDIFDLNRGKSIDHLKTLMEEYMSIIMFNFNFNFNFLTTDYCIMYLVL